LITKNYARSNHGMGYECSSNLLIKKCPAVN
jgi:hypothetical protein